MQVDNISNKALNNALNTGLQGFQDAQSRAGEAAQNIASQSVNTSDSLSANSSSINQKDLTTSLVDLKVAELDAKANVKVIQTASDLIGSLLDIRA